MTEYALAPAGNFTAENPGRTPRVMLEQGFLQAYRVRGNGTMRHISLYPLDSTMRETAEYISDRVEMDGASVTRVSSELHISPATVRRFLEGLELTEEIESGEWDDLSFDASGEPVWAYGSTTEEISDEPVALVDEIKDLLDNPPSVADLIDAQQAGTDVAPRPRPRTRRTAPVVDQAAKDAELLARNAARFTKPATATTEPAEPTVTAPAATRATDLHVCYCTPGGSASHAPGAPGCKNVAMPARKVRSH